MTMDEERLLAVERRLARMETRLVQLMLFLGADPYGENVPAIVRRTPRGENIPPPPTNA